MQRFKIKQTPNTYKTKLGTALFTMKHLGDMIMTRMGFFDCKMVYTIYV